MSANPSLISVITAEQILEKISAIALSIHQGLQLDEILAVGVRQAHQLLQSDRVLICRLSVSESTVSEPAIISTESVNPEWLSLLGQSIQSTYFKADQLECYRQGQISQIADITTSDVEPCYQEFLAHFQVQASLEVPIVVQGSVWGLLIAHHCRGQRTWQPLEVQFLQQAALQLGIAIQQSALQQQIENRFTAHKAAELALQQSQQQYQTLVNSMNGIVWEANPQTLKFTFVSQQAESILGYPLKSWLEPNFWLNHLHPDDRERAVTLCAQATQCLQDHRMEYRMIAADGRVVWLYDTVRVVVENGQAVNLIGLMVEATQQKQAEKLLQEREQAYRALVENSPDIIERFDTNLRHLYVSPSLTRITGIPANVFLGKTCRDLGLSIEMVNTWEAAAQRLLATGEKQLIEFETPTLDGVRCFEMAIAPELTHEKVIQSILCISRDITDRKTGEAILRQYERIVSATPDCVALVNCNYIYQAINQTYEVWNDKPSQEIIGYSVSDLLGEALFKSIKPYLDCSFAGKTEQLDTWVNYRGVGQKFVRATYAPYVELDGRISGAVINVHDLTNLKHMEAALSESEERFRQMADSIHEVFWMADVNFTEILYVSPAYEKIWGRSCASLYQQPASFLEAVHPDDRSRVLTNVEQLRQSGFSHEYRLIQPNGNIRWIWERATPVRDATGEPYRLVGISQDITERKATEEALRISEEQRRLALELTQLGSWDWNLLTGELAWSEQTYALLGYTPGDPSYAAWRDRLPVEDLKAVEAAIAQSQVNRTYFSCEYRIIHPDGSIHWILARGRTLYNESQQPVRMIGIVMAIDDRKQLEIALQKSEERYRQIVETATEGIWVLDTNHATTFVNPCMAEMLGYSDSEMMGKSFFDFMDEEGKVIAARLIERRRQGIVEQHDFKFQHKDGSEVWTLISTRPILDEVGRYTGALGMLANITDRKTNELALQRQTQREQALNRVFQAIRNSLDLDTIFATATAETARLLQVERVQIAQYLPEHCCWRIVASYHKANLTDTVGLEIPEADNPLSEQLKRGETVRIENTDVLTDEVNQKVAETLPGAWLLLPVMHQDTVWGSLTVNSTQRSFTWSDEQITLVQAVADQLAIAIQQANLYRQTQLELAERQRAEVALQQLNQELEQRVQERTEALQHQAEQERLLRLVTQHIHESFNLEEILETALTATRQTLLADRVAIYRFNSDWSGNFVAESVDAGWVPLVGPNIQKVWEDTYLQKTKGGRYQNDETFAVNDIYAVGHMQCHIDLLEQFQAKAYAIAPIFVHDVLWGLLAAYQNSTSRQWRDEDVMLLKQIAVQMAIAIQQSELYQISQTQVKELERLNQVKDDFLSTVSHELRSPMTNIKMATQMLEIQLSRSGALNSPGTTNINRYFTILKEQSEREIQLINDLLDLARLDASTEPLTWTKICLASWVEQLAGAFVERTKQQQQQLKLDIPTDLELETEVACLERILAELLHNACKYTPAGETIRVCAKQIAVIQDPTPPTASQNSHSKIQICVSNSGVEILPEECDRIFDKFYRIPKNDPWKHGGTGLGLALVKKLTERLGGNIHVESDANQTTFILEFSISCES